MNGTKNCIILNANQRAKNCLPVNEATSRNYVLVPFPQVQERIKQIWDEKLRVTEKEKGEGGLPRIVRLSRRLKLSEKETLVMIYVLTCQVGEARTSAIRFGRFAGRHYLVLTSFPTSFPDCSSLIPSLILK